MLLIQIRDPGSGAFLTPASGPGPGIGFRRIPDLENNQQCLKILLCQLTEILGILYLVKKTK